ncbi:hypothetical protein ACOSOMT5_P1376 [Acidiphilium sp. MT5]
MKQSAAILSELALSWAIVIPAIWLSFPLAHALQPYPKLHFLMWITGLFFIVLLHYTDKITYRYFGTNQRILRIRRSDIYRDFNNNWQIPIRRALLKASSYFSGGGLMSFLAMIYGLYPFNNRGGHAFSTFSGVLFVISTISVGFFLVFVIWFLVWPLIKYGYHDLSSGNLT